MDPDTRSEPVERIFIDDLDVEWTLFLEPVEDPAGTVDQEAVLHAVPDDDADEREVRAVGPADEVLAALDDAGLALAVEAAGDGRGILWAHPEGVLWWVRRGADDPTAEGEAMTFTGVEDTHHYHGGLAADPAALSEDELLEILDEARGAVRP